MRSRSQQPIGAGIDIARPCGNMIVDIGGGTADIAVISLGGSVVSTSVKIAGDDFDEAIVRYMRKKHNLLIGERTAEDIKIKIGTCFPLAQNETMDVRGRNLVTGLPKTVTVSSEETEEEAARAYFADRRGSTLCIGENSTGACRRCCRPRYRTYRWRCIASWSGRTDRGQNRNQYYDSR